MPNSALAIPPRAPQAQSTRPIIIATKAFGVHNRPLQPVRTPLPKHEHAEKHYIFIAAKRSRTKARLRKVEHLEASGVVACKRIREFAWDLGHEYGWKYGWKMKASEKIGLNYRTLWNILKGVVTTVNTATVDRVARHSGVPIPFFYDPEM